jgi:hypothetical protein
LGETGLFGQIADDPGNHYGAHKGNDHATAP